jgi:murein L,D-transpeptidase YafK
MCAAPAVPCRTARAAGITAPGRARPARRVLLAVFWCLLGAAESGMAGAVVVVDTVRSTLTVETGGRVVLELDDIAIGRFGATPAKRRADGMTPLGHYRVAGIRTDSAFHTFIAIDYPSPADADRALAAGWISPREHRAIVAAHRRGALPPQNTALGGHLGIHGLGSADPEVHRRFNWTRGCVAVTDEQVERLLPFIAPGVPVEIR